LGRAFSKMDLDGEDFYRLQATRAIGASDELDAWTLEPTGGDSCFFDQHLPEGAS